eukprot:6176891-Pleurochrysis_carterae.AAC.2
MQDPQIRVIHESYTASKEDQETSSPQRINAHSMRTYTNLRTRHQWVGVSTHQMWTASACTTTALFRSCPRTSLPVGNRRTPRCGCDGQSLTAALLLGRNAHSLRANVPTL